MNIPIASWMSNFQDLNPIGEVNHHSCAGLLVIRLWALNGVNFWLWYPCLSATAVHCSCCNNSNNTRTDPHTAGSCTTRADYQSVSSDSSLSADELADDMVGGRGHLRKSRHAGGEDGGGNKKSRFAALAQTKGPTFYIAGNNGNGL